MKVLANAKINLNLSILQKDDNNYHTLYSVMVPISLYDEMEIVLNNSGEIRISVEGQNDIDNENNICYKMIVELKKVCKFNQGVDVKIKKNIPLGAGLGGGSSNAAALLKSLNEMLKLNLNEEEMINISKNVGADVPFFIINKTSYVEGYGEKVTPFVMKKFNPYILLVKPSFSLNTIDVYKMYDRIGATKEYRPLIFHKLLEENKVEEFDYYFKNDLQRAACFINKNIQIILEELEKQGSNYSLMSGSGSCVFGIFFDYNKAQQACDKFKEDKYFSKLVKIIQ